MVNATGDYKTIIKRYDIVVYVKTGPVGNGAPLDECEVEWWWTSEGLNNSKSSMTV